MWALAGVVFLLAGCQGPCRVYVEGDAEFPKQLAGTWKSEEGSWTIVFKEDGQISLAVIPLGKVTVRPGKVTRFPTRFGGKGIFEPGIWTVTYIPKDRELTVEIVIKHFLQDVGNHSMEGNQTNVLVGDISDDWSEWQVDWFSMGRFYALLYDGWDLRERRELPDSSEQTLRGSIVLKKE